LIKKCPVHDREYSYTCAACEYEAGYAVSGGNTRALIDAFRAGCNGKRPPSTGAEERAAYKRGEWFRKNPYNRGS